MKIKVKKYKEQLLEWPQKGYHIMAQYDDEKNHCLSVLQRIGDFAVKNQYFGGDFSLKE
jgi:hypothetical protein